MSSYPHTDIDTMLAALDGGVGAPEDFSLAEASQGGFGIDMVSIVDRLLAKGLEPVGVGHPRGFRMYRH